MYLDAGLDGGGLGGAEELADEDEAVLGPALAQRPRIVLGWRRRRHVVGPRTFILLPTAGRGGDGKRELVQMASDRSRRHAGTASAIYDMVDTVYVP